MPDNNIKLLCFLFDSFIFTVLLILISKFLCYNSDQDDTLFANVISRQRKLPLVKERVKMFTYYS